MTTTAPPRLGVVALAWLGHPVTLVAVAVLLLNDHVLKAAAPGLVTGKLSDVAGLVMAPPLLAVAAGLAAPRLPARPVAVAAVVLVAVGFAAVKAGATGAAAASEVWSALRGPSTIRADRTDLLTLPAAVLAWWVVRRCWATAVPPRAVRFMRVTVVLPAAALAVVATSAGTYPEATHVVAREGDLVVLTGDSGGRAGDDVAEGVVTTDGRAWRDLTATEARGLSRRAEPATVACTAAAPAHCYRVVRGRLAVEESTDGAATWRTAWQMSDGRRRFLTRAYPEAHSSLTSSSVGLVRTPRGEVVVVANDRDGLLVRDESGQWRRIGFPTARSAGHGLGSPAAPPALTDRGARLSAEYAWTIVAVSLGIFLALVGAPARPGRRWVVPVLLLPLAFALLLWSGAMRFSSAGAVPTVIGLAVVLAAALTGVVAGGAAPVWRVVALSALGVACVALAMQPFVGWSAGNPDEYAPAAARAALIGSVGIGVMVAVGQLWRLARGRPHP